MSYDWRHDAQEAANPDTPGWLLMRAVRDHRVSVRRAVAANPALPSDARSALLRDPDQRVRGAAAVAAVGSKSLPGLFDMLNTYLHPSDVREVAEDYLGRLIEDGDKDTRMALASHPALPMPLAERLTLDSDPEIAEAAREGVKTWQSAAAALASADDPETRTLAIYHPGLTPDILTLLVEDPDEGVAVRAKERFLRVLAGAEPESLGGV